jgi:hypothetical protein
MGTRFLVSMHNLLPESLIPKSKQYEAAMATIHALYTSDGFYYKRDLLQ